MSLFDTPEQMRLLQNLLYPPEHKQNDSDSDDGGESLVRNNITPATIGPSKSQSSASSKSQGKPFQSPYAPANDAKNTNETPKTMEEWEKQQEEDRDLLDDRKCPEYTLTYCQKVGTEDVFLQMSQRTNATASCEDILIEIELPDETVPAEKMNLSITENEVNLSTPVYRLKLPLAHKVNVDRCRAKYEADTHKLCLTLRLQRELDFINF